MTTEPMERCTARDDRNPARQCSRPEGHDGPHDCGYSFVLATDPWPRPDRLPIAAMQARA